MANDHYRNFVDEAFVEPIRSVLIVDDQYPTYDEVLRHRDSAKSDQGYVSEKNWQKNPERIRKVIRRFRKNDPPLLVDIHDGQNVDPESETVVAEHLHQSDLLVLDYNLEGTTGGGARAIETLRHLTSNDHFNLVVIYTNEDIDNVFESVRWGLLAPTPNQLTKEQRDQVVDLIDDAETESMGLHDRLRNSIDSEQYFYSRLHPSKFGRMMEKGEAPYTTFRHDCEEAGIHSSHYGLVLAYYLEVKQDDHSGQMNTKATDDTLTWSTDASPKWIKGNSLFVCFSNKSDDDDLLNDLRSALYNWNPHPSRLFLTKLRAVVDERGMVAQTQALTQKHAMAYWYHQLMGADQSERLWRVSETVVRHSDNLMSEILPDVERFALELINAEADAGEAQLRCRQHFGVDFSSDEDEKLAMLEHNAFVCSKEPVGWHLTTGHVFSMEDMLWLCLSPACDMVPSQMKNWRKELVGDRLPFVAIQLYPRSELPKDIHSNRYVFLRLNDSVEIYCFNHPSSSDSAPRWETLHAENAGRFLEGTFELSVWRTQQRTPGEGLQKQTPKLVVNCHSATVVSQLRYEYALNLIQKLGLSLTRIGLDFSGGID